MSSVPVTRSTAVKRTRSRSKSKAAAASRVLALAMTFVVVSASTYLASSLFGQVMLENARREGIVAQRRATEAKRSEVLLRARINELTGFSNLESWAVSHGFIAPDQPAVPSGDVTRVAQLDR